jgi:hypothetical protein
MDETLPFLFPLFFIGMWMAVGFFIALIGGWQSLAEKYGAGASEFAGQRWFMCSGAMRGSAHYNNVLTIGADARGLYLGVMFLFRFGHPPLYITWADITVTERKGWVFSYVEFTFKDVPGVHLTVARKLGVKITEAAGRPLAGEDSWFIR